MRVEGSLHLGGEDVRPSGYDHVGAAVDEGQEALLVQVAEIADRLPAVALLLGLGTKIEVRRALPARRQHVDLADLASRQLFARLGVEERIRIDRLRIALDELGFVLDADGPAPRQQAVVASAAYLIVEILVVDDEAGCREGLRRLLEAWGYEAETAASGEEALALDKQSRPDVVLLDLEMPELDGVEVLEALAQPTP